MSAQKQAGSLLQIRMDDRLRYLTNLAVAATGKTLTEFVSESLEDGFKRVSLYRRATIERVYGLSPEEASANWKELIDPTEDAEAKAHLMLDKQADLLWSESAITRLEVLEIVAPHLVSKEDAGFLEWLRNQEEYRIYEGSYWKLDRTRIDAEWDLLKARFATRHVPRPKRSK